MYVLCPGSQVPLFSVFCDMKLFTQMENLYFGLFKGNFASNQNSQAK